MKASATDIDEKIFRCWNDGLSIAATRGALKRTHGLNLTFEDVRQRFVALAGRRL